MAKEEERYVAYVSTYTQGDTHGIKVYDVDMEKGRFQEKSSIDITNSSYMAVSHNHKYLYSITDMGVEAYRIMPDGDLEFINFGGINGMRGCYLFTDYTDRYLFVSGYHDGKLTILWLEDDGSIGPITDEVYLKGMSSMAERNSRPHVNCARMTHDNKYLLVADSGMDHVKVYSFDLEHGKVKMVDILHSEQNSGPRHIKISLDGRFVYVVHEWSCMIDVYSYGEENGQPVFEKIQSIPTVKNERGSTNAASALSFDPEYKYLLSSNAGDNSVVVFSVDQEKGFLDQIFRLPVSGAYPKDAEFFPNSKYLVSLNHESNNMTFFKLDLEKGCMIMNGPAVEVDAPNCIVFYRLGSTSGA